MTLTSEQSTILQFIKDNEVIDLLKINAVAGSGKSFISVKIIEHLDGAGIYLVFNKANQVEMSKKINNKCDTRTFASLAAKFLYQRKHKIDFSTNINFFYFKSIVDKKYSNEIDYYQRSLLSKHLADFYKFYSHSTELSVAKSFSKYLNKFESNDPKLTRFTSKMQRITKNFISDWYLKMLNKELDIPQNSTSKIFYSLLKQELISLKYDYVILDEAGDVNPLDVEIFRMITAKKKILLGDKNQSIYSFRSSVNAFYLLDYGTELPLSQSFRVPSHLGELIHNFGEIFLESGFKFTGSDNTPDLGTKAVLFRTNIGIFEHVLMSNSDEVYSFMKSVKTLFEPIVHALEYVLGVRDYPSFEYKYLADLKKEFEKDHDKPPSMPFITWLSDNYPYDEIEILLSKLQKMSIVDIRKTYDRMLKMEETSDRDIHTTLTTAFLAKGMEWDEVTISYDFDRKLSRLFKNRKYYKDPINRLPFLAKEEFRLLYVAVTRATKKLNGYIHYLTDPEEWLSTMRGVKKCTNGLSLLIGKMSSHSNTLDKKVT